jgi:phosphate transport system substrate-binding protein
MRIFFALAALTAMVCPLAMAFGQTLTLKASPTLLGLNQKWAEAYQAKHAGISVVVTGEETSAAILDLVGKKADIIVLPRAIHYQEAQACEAAFGRRPLESKIAASGVAVYLNTNNPVKELTYDELSDIIQGQTQNWKDLDGGLDQVISVYGQQTNTVFGELFNEEVLNGRGFPAAVHLLSGPEVVKAVAGNPGAIGFGALDPAEGVQIVSIKRVRSSTPVIPTGEKIARRIYPISRYVFSYVNPAANPEGIKAYLDWIRSDEGQQIARQAGFYALPAILRSIP